MVLVGPRRKTASQGGAGRSIGGTYSDLGTTRSHPPVPPQSSISPSGTTRYHQYHPPKQIFIHTIFRCVERQILKESYFVGIVTWNIIVEQLRAIGVSLPTILVCSQRQPATYD